MHYSVRITETGKTPWKQDDFQVFNWEHLSFATLQEAKDALQARYSRTARSHRRKVYRETEAGPEHTGYIYRFRNADFSHSPVEWWIQEDWVEIVQVEEHTLVA